MAERPVFYIDGTVKKENVTFKWFPGFSVQQKQRSVQSLHEGFKRRHKNDILEVSTKSTDPLGVKMSAFNLYFDEGITLESYYQASKVFSKGGPFRELAYLPSREAKKDERLKNSGKITGFRDYRSDMEWSLDEPYYDYIYCKACVHSLTEEDLDKLLKFDAFTDIEFNPAHSRNTQARAAAVLKLLYSNYGYEALQNLNKTDFIRFYKLFVTI